MTRFRRDLLSYFALLIGTLVFPSCFESHYSSARYALPPVNNESESIVYQGVQVLNGVTALTGFDLKPFQTIFMRTELPDPFATQLPDSVVVSGTASYFLKFPSLDALRNGGPYRIIWRDFRFSNGVSLGNGSHTWDLKPVAWVESSRDDSSSSSVAGRSSNFRLWDAERDAGRTPALIWYGGSMRARDGATLPQWPSDNFSRDVFAYLESSPGTWISMKDSIFSKRKDWPRANGNFLGHRYGHHIVMVPKQVDGKITQVPAIFYEEVTRVQPNGRPLETSIFMDEMESPVLARGMPVPLVKPVNPRTGQPFPRAVRDDGSLLVEGPLYFRFQFENEEWEAIGFSAGSYFGSYSSSFASRKVSDGLLGKPYEVDLSDDGTDLNDAGLELGKLLNLAGGPGRPAVVVDSNGKAAQGPLGKLQLLFQGYRKDILPDNDWTKFPVKYRFDQMFRAIFHAQLEVTRGPRGALRFRISVPQGQPQWQPAPLAPAAPVPASAAEIAPPPVVPHRRAS